MRHKKRMKASLTARHLQGLPLEFGKEIIAELLERSEEPFLPQTDHLFKIEGLSTPDQPEEPILSIYANGLTERLVIPMSRFRDVALVPAADLEGKAIPADSPLACTADQRAAGFLVLFPTEGEAIVFACPRHLRSAHKIMEYYCQVTRPGAAGLTLEQLGIH